MRIWKWIRAKGEICGLVLLGSGRICRWANWPVSVNSAQEERYWTCQNQSSRYPLKTALSVCFEQISHRAHKYKRYFWGFCDKQHLEVLDWNELQNRLPWWGGRVITVISDEILILAKLIQKSEKISLSPCETCKMWKHWLNGNCTTNYYNYWLRSREIIRLTSPFSCVFVRALLLYQEVCHGCGGYTGI